MIAVMTSAGFDDMLENWLCFVAELGIQNYFIISDSLDQAQRVAGRGHSAFHLNLRAHGNRSLDYGTIGYKQVGGGDGRGNEMGVYGMAQIQEY